MVDRPGVQVQQCIQLTGTNITYAFLIDSLLLLLFISHCLGRQVVHSSLVMSAAGIHPVTFRTRQLSLLTPKILGFGPGR